MRKVCGVGINDMPRGWANKNKLNRSIYDRWKHMLQRCYDRKCNQYHNYGAKGVYVEEALKRLSVYYNVLRKDSLWEGFCKNPDFYHIDKDLKVEGCKYYGVNTIQIVEARINEREGLKKVDRASLNKRRGRPVRGVNIETKEVRTYSSLIGTREDGFDDRAVSKVCKGTLKQHKGWKFEYID